MKSLAYLNEFGATSIEVSDSRPAGVVFKRKPPLGAFDRSVTFTPSSLSIMPEPGNEITEVINYSTANVRYRVKIVSLKEPLTGSTVSWGTLPAGVTLTQDGTTYTLSGIKSVAHWDAVRKFTWTVPSNYNASSLWFLEVAVVYYDQALASDQVEDWIVYDPEYYYVSEMTSSASLSLTGNSKVRLLSSAMTSEITCVTSATKAFGAIAYLNAVSTVVAEGGVNIINANSVSTLSMDGNIIIGSRNYLANKANQLFTTGYVYDVNAGQTYTITFSCDNGKFSASQSETPVSPWSYTGTVSQVNSAMVNLRFYPDKDYSSNTTTTYSRIKGGVTEYTQSIALNGSDNAFNARTYTFTSGTTLVLTQEDILYGRADLLIIGGGGGATRTYEPYPLTDPYPGSGGGGGGVREYFNQYITTTSYTITVGSGGAASANNTADAVAGQPSFAFGFTAGGGEGASVTLGGGKGGTPNGGTPPRYSEEGVITTTQRLGGGGAGAIAGNTFDDGLFSTLYPGMELGAGGELGGSAPAFKYGAGGWYYGSVGSEVAQPGSQGLVVVKIHA